MGTRASGLIALLLVAGCGDDGEAEMHAGTDATSSDAMSSGSDATGPAATGTSQGTTQGPETSADTSGDTTDPPDTTTGPGNDASLAFVLNAPTQHDYAQQLSIPPGFGNGEFTFELWVRPDDSFPFGPTSGGEEQLTNWSDADNMPYGSGDWWYDGNFLLDGHNNGGFANGTFSLQFYGSGRVRWLFGDGDDAGPGGHWSVGAYPADTTPTLVDGDWHQITLVRRFGPGEGSTLELWVDGALVDTETTPGQPDMRQWFDDWSDFPGNQLGWFWGAEKQAAVAKLDQYEDYKGLVSELRFWSVAKSSEVIEASWNAAVAGDEPGLVGYIPFDEGGGTQVCDRITDDCFDVIQPGEPLWSSDRPPLL